MMQHILYIKQLEQEGKNSRLEIEEDLFDMDFKDEFEYHAFPFDMEEDLFDMEFKDEFFTEEYVTWEWYENSKNRFIVYFFCLIRFFRASDDNSNNKFIVYNFRASNVVYNIYICILF